MRRGRKPSTCPQHTDAEALGGIAQIAILAGKRNAEPHRELQVGGFIGRQPFLAGEIEGPRERPGPRFFIYIDLERLQQGDEFGAFCCCNSPAALNERQQVGDFDVPKIWHRSCFGSKTLK